MWKQLCRYLPYAVLAALFMVAEVLADLLQPKLMSSLVDEGVLGLGNDGQVNLPLIGEVGLKMLLIVLLGGAAGCLCNLFVQLSAQNFGNAVRKDSFDAIMRLSFPEIDSFGTGTLITRITNDVSQVERLVAMFSRGMVRTVMMTAGSIYFMFTLNPEFGVMVLCAFPLILLVMLLCLLRANPLFAKLQKELDTVNTMVQEDLFGIRIIKAFVRETYEKLRFEKANLALIGTQLRVLIFFAFMNPVINALMNLVVALLLLEGGARVEAGTATPGSIMAAISYVTLLINSVMMLLFLSQNLSRGFISWGRLKQLQEYPLSITDGPVASPPPFPGSIEFKQVSFTYPNSGFEALTDINFKINQGEFVAIMGATGSGKSTLLNLIARFYEVSSGEVLLGGTNVKNYELATLRSLIALAPQHSELFSLSIRENIAWGSRSFEPTAAQEEIDRAAQIAQAAEFIAERPSGYDDLLSAGGTTLSGGQRQRLCMARAVLRRAPVLLCDDATSALDLKTEARLLRALRTELGNTTLVMVAQRISTARLADRIILIDEGRICAQGTHEELKSTSTVYQEICRSQLGQDEQETSSVSQPQGEVSYGL